MQRTTVEEISSSRAIFSGKVLYTNRSLQWKWLRAKYQIFDWMGITSSEFIPREDGVRVTFQVTNSWKGLQEDVVTLITGFGYGDCGIPFETGEEYLVYVDQYSDWWYDIDMCSRTNLLKDARSDIVMLGPPLKLTHKSVVLHFAKFNTVWIVSSIAIATGIAAYFKFRKRRKNIKP